MSGVRPARQRSPPWTHHADEEVLFCTETHWHADTNRHIGKDARKKIPMVHLGLRQAAVTPLKPSMTMCEWSTMTTWSNGDHPSPPCACVP